MTAVLVLTGDGIGARMAGPAVRAWHLARVLAADGHDVVLATTGSLDPEGAAQALGTSSFTVTRVAAGDAAAFAPLHDAAEVVILQGHGTEQFPVLLTTPKALVVDAYDPMHLEMLEQGREQPRATWDLLVASRTELLNEQLAAADLVLCASSRQRSFYLGQLAALGRITPTTYDGDPHLERLLAVVPYGLTPERPARPAARAVLPGIADTDRVLVWGGGLYSWFDPLSLIRAVAAVAADDPRVRLVFLGTKHPGIAPMGIVKESLDLAAELGVLGGAVVFNEGWVPYAERGGWLAEADAGVSTHHAHLETEFSFRTRILDYLWAGLPMVVTDGDAFADLIAAEGLGAVVPADDVEALAAGIRRVLLDDGFAAEARANVERVAERFTWERVLEPVRAFVAAPALAADVRANGRRGTVAGRRSVRGSGAGRDLRMAWHHLRHGGPGAVWRRLRARLGR